MDLLISEVKKRPALWDKTHKFYRHRVYGEKSWDAISKVTGISSKHAKDKWKNLRDHFKREVHKIPDLVENDPISLRNAYTGKWKYFPSLMFLIDLVRPLDSTRLDDIELDNDSIKNDEGNDHGADFEMYRDEDSSSSPLAFNSRTSSEASNSKNEPRSSENDKHIDDSDLYYLQSLLPYFKELSPLRKLQVRKQFENVLIGELAAATAEASQLPPTDTIIKLEHSAQFD
ncbi:hypothetical protein RN001_004533 [Aquatica leii]|uniref:Transcription factor Adf-1 n=1 Tax=Aquatica leii TaxID=1421715 RepID=A0AAN7PBH3_9COLE|nr:hypothetical protein RN001_004533 [Aquatica leii]